MTVPQLARSHLIKQIILYRIDKTRCKFIVRLLSVFMNWDFVMVLDWHFCYLKAWSLSLDNLVYLFSCLVRKLFFIM